MQWRCDHVTVSYHSDDERPIPALAEVSLTIVSGERLAIVGPNGSGKSTLALCLAGLIQPTHGRVVVDGLHEPAYGAIVFQSPEDNLIGATVLEEMMLTLEHTSLPGTDEVAVRAELERFGLGYLAGRSTDSLSGGEKQKVAVACARAAGRQLIVLDEPTSHLDPPSRREFLAFSEAAAESGPSRGPKSGGLKPPVRERSAGNDDCGPTLVFITQYEEEARRLPRVIELNAGRIAYDGPSSGWKGMVDPRPRVISLPVPPEDASVIVSAVDLGQCDSPAWPLPLDPLRGITLEVRAGEAVGLCGPIGAGKTTLAFYLAGLFDRWLGQLNWPGMPRRERPVVLIQFPERQLFCSTVIDDVAAGPRARGGRSSDLLSAARAALDRVGLPPDDFGHRSPFDLSGGQKRRAALAGIVAIPSRLYLLDEPQAALDSEGLERLESLLQEWLGAGSAYVIISHDLEFLRRLTHRVWVMNKGRIIFDGPWEALDSQPVILASIGF